MLNVQIFYVLTFAFPKLNPKSKIKLKLSIFLQSKKFFQNIFPLKTIFQISHWPLENHKDLLFHLIKREVLEVFKFIWYITMDGFNRKNCQIRRDALFSLG